jgi:hypothetical protein
MPLPLLLALAAPAVFSTTEAVFIGIGSFLGGTVITGAGFGLHKWFKGSNASLENMSTPLQSMGRQVIENQSSLINMEATQIKFLASVINDESTKLSAQEINAAAANLSDTINSSQNNFFELEQSCRKILEKLSDEPEFRTILIERLETINSLGRNPSTNSKELSFLIQNLRDLVDSRYVYLQNDQNINREMDFEAAMSFRRS